MSNKLCYHCGGTADKPRIVINARFEEYQCPSTFHWAYLKKAPYDVAVGEEN